MLLAPFMQYSSDSQRLLTCDYDSDSEVESKNGCYSSLLAGLGKFFGCCCIFTCCGCCCYPYQTVNVGEKGVIQKFGKVKNIVGEGLHYVNPVTETLTKVSIMTNTKKLANQKVLTKDNLPMLIDGVVYYRTVDVIKSRFLVSDIDKSVEEMSHAALRNICGHYTLQECSEKRSELASEIKNIISKQSEQWGITVEDIQIIDMTIPPNIQQMLASSAIADRECMAKLKHAEADVTAAKMLREAADTLSTPAAQQMRYLEALKEVAHSPNTKVLMFPTNVTNFSLLANEM